MEKETDFQFDSYCGIHCGSCFVLRSYKDKRQIDLIEPWSEWLKDMTMQCHGCKSDDVFDGKIVWRQFFSHSNKPQRF